MMASTATATPRVRRDIVEVLALEDPVRVVGSFDRPNLTWHVERADHHRSKIRALRRHVRSVSGALVVYAGTRRMVEVIRANLAGLGVSVAAYHAGHERVWHGLDKSDVRVVVHYQLPGTYKEAGRAGRR